MPSPFHYIPGRILPPGVLPPQSTSFEQETDNIFSEAENLLLRKHKDYGPYNISRAPGGPLVGVAVRLHDKVARIANLMNTGITPEHESLRDSLIDAANYALIGVLVIDGKWPQ